MNRIIRKGIALFAVCSMVALSASCDLLGLSEEEDDTAVFALAALALSSSSALASCSGGASTTSATIANKTASIGGDGCINGVVTSMDSNLPSWIKDNFKCSVGWVSSDGNYYCFKSTNLPNHKSYYWAGKTEVDAGNSGLYNLYEALPTYDSTAHTSAGTNVITQQNFLYAIPANPSQDTDGTLSGTQSGLSSIGITRNGMAIFNNAAAPGDTLSSEASTFSLYGSHPQEGGIVHHHAYVYQYSDTQPTSPGATTNINNDANLLGIALDGYAVYGLKCDNATSSTGDDFEPTDLDSNHGHTRATTHFSTATYHYHYDDDATAGIKTLMGSYFYGNIGAVSN